MTNSQLQRHDWEAVQEALSDLLEHTTEHEPGAVNFLRELESVLAGLPENE